MKKLYAKTSFSSKNRSTKSNHKAVNETLSTSSSSQAEIYKYHDPILAYQTTPAKPKDTNIKYTPKHPFVSKFHNLHAGSATAASAAVAVASSPTVHNDESPYYYTITELENLHMLDHRHPHFHHLQRMQQLQHCAYNNNTNNKVQYHQHNQLVLQLPPASSATSNDVVDGFQQQQQQPRLISPIYEAPQMNLNSQSQHYNYNQHNHNNTNTTTSLSATTKASLVSQISSTTPPPPPHHLISSPHCATAQTPSTASTLSASTPLDVYNQNCNNNYDQNQPQLALSILSSPSSSMSLSSISTSSSSSLSTPRDNLSSKTDFMTSTSNTTISPTIFAYVFF